MRILRIVYILMPFLQHATKTDFIHVNEDFEHLKPQIEDALTRETQGRYYELCLGEKSNIKLILRVSPGNFALSLLKGDYHREVCWIAHNNHKSTADFTEGLITSGTVDRILEQACLKLKSKRLLEIESSEESSEPQRKKQRTNDLIMRQRWYHVI